MTNFCQILLSSQFCVYVSIAMVDSLCHEAKSNEMKTKQLLFSKNLA